MATLANLRTRISAELSLDNTASSAEQVLVDARCNEAVLKILLRTHCHVAVTTMALIANTKDYNLDTGLLAVHKILESDGVPLEEYTAEEILELRRASSTTSSASYVYAVDGGNLLMVYPTPSAADSLTVYYVPRPTVMSDAAHDPSSVTYGRIPAEFHELIEFYACSRLASYDDDQSSAQGERYTLLFERGIGEMRKHMSRRGSRKLPRARIVPPRGRRWMPADPSTDIR